MSTDWIDHALTAVMCVLTFQQNQILRGSSPPPAEGVAPKKKANATDWVSLGHYWPSALLVVVLGLYLSRPLLVPRSLPAPPSAAEPKSLATHQSASSPEPQNGDIGSPTSLSTNQVLSLIETLTRYPRPSTSIKILTASEHKQVANDLARSLVVGKCHVIENEITGDLFFLLPDNTDFQKGITVSAKEGDVIGDIISSSLRLTGMQDSLASRPLTRSIQINSQTLPIGDKRNYIAIEISRGPITGD